MCTYYNGLHKHMSNTCASTPYSVLHIKNRDTYAHIANYINTRVIHEHKHTHTHTHTTAVYIKTAVTYVHII
jgi:hypothetical protein